MPVVCCILYFNWDPLGKMIGYCNLILSCLNEWIDFLDHSWEVHICYDWATGVERDCRTYKCVVTIRVWKGQLSSYNLKWILQLQRTMMKYNDTLLYSNIHTIMTAIVKNANFCCCKHSKSSWWLHAHQLLWRNNTETDCDDKIVDCFFPFVFSVSSFSFTLVCSWEVAGRLHHPGGIWQ